MATGGKRTQDHRRRGRRASSGGAGGGVGAADERSGEGVGLLRARARPAGRGPRARPLRGQRGARPRGAVPGRGRGPARRPGPAAAARAIRANIETLRIRAIGPSSGSPRWPRCSAARPGRPVRPGVLDPPYDTPAAEVEAVLQRLVEGEWLGPTPPSWWSGRPVRRLCVWPAGWGSTWERCYGDTLVLFAQRK